MEASTSGSFQTRSTTEAGTSGSFQATVTSVNASELVQDVENGEHSMGNHSSPKTPEKYEFASPATVEEIIKCTEIILNTQDTLNKIRCEITACYLCNSLMAAQPAQIEKKIRKLVDELHRVRAVIEFQSQVQMTLHSFRLETILPNHGNNNQKSILDVISVMPKMIKEMKDNVENLEWFLKFQPTTNAEQVSTVVAQTFSHLQYITNQLREFHTALKKLYGTRWHTLKDASDEEVLRHFDQDSSCDWKEQKLLNHKLLEPNYFVQYTPKYPIKKQ